MSARDKGRVPVLAVLPRVLRLALRTIVVFRARSVFIVLAVAFGVAALTVIVAAMEGAGRKAEELADTFGPSAIFVAGGNLMYQPMGNRPRTLTWNDVRRVGSELPGAVSAQPFLLREKMPASGGGRRHLVASVVGTGENYRATWNWPLAEGEDFTAADVQGGAGVCLLGSMVARGLFGSRSPVGDVVVLDRVPLVVRGVLQPRNIVAAGVEQDDRIVLPATTMVRRFNLDRTYLNGIRINFASPEGMDGNAKRVQALLRVLHDRQPDEADDFLVVSPLVVLRFVSFLKGGFGVFLGVTALAALLVGGFILANLFHLSVAERQTEIGMKKAIGATDAAILMQFLAEALYLTTLGAMAGLGLGLVIARMLERLDMLTLRLSPAVFMAAFVAALAVALVFGLQPARRAARMEPVAALKEGA
ncbi:ABC transporter permease [Nitratidesulfovibrio sp. 1201_IL3209]|uniref:ABC transporter permease n=1 Tax=Nitratidesulfovibrio sp. 1201_IL3209 TaxID=3084053 RepID=UPI002FDAF3AA